MPRPRSANPAKTVALYLRGEHLDTLRRFHHKPADAIRALIEQAAASQPSRPDQAVGALVLCARCEAIGVPSCRSSIAAAVGGLPRPAPARQRPSLCRRCVLIGVPSCPACIRASVG
jgi:hypothetical protein